MAPNINFVPIKLTPLPVPAGTKAANWDQLLTIISQYIAGQIQQNVSFFQTFANPPGYNAGSLIYVENRKNFFVWNTSTGQYDLLSQFILGDIKQSAIDGDDTLNGWIKLDGRAISSVSGISTQQGANLLALFPNGTLPNIAPLLNPYPYNWHIPGAFVSGTFTDSEEIVQAGSLNATAFIIGNQSAGTFLNIVDLDGHPSTVQNWVGQSSGAIFAPSGNPIMQFGTYPAYSKVYCGNNTSNV